MTAGMRQLRWARDLIREKTAGKQRLAIGWDGMPVVRMDPDCRVGLYFVLLRNQKNGLYDCRARGYIRTCGGYHPSAGMQDLTGECSAIAALVGQIERADIHVTQEDVQRFCEELEEELHGP